MSLLAKNTGLILLSALLIFSCKEKENVGLELKTEDNKFGTIFTDTLSLATTAILENDSIPTHNQSYAYAGAFENVDFGNAYGETYTQLLLQGVIPTTVDPAFIVDSVEMSLGFDYFYGNTLESQTINVHKLTTPIKDSTYFSISDPHPYETSTILDKDSVWTLDPVKSTGLLKLKLKESFGGEIINLINAGNNTNTTFVPSFPGIALVPKDKDKGALLRIKLHDNSSKITIYYRNNVSDPEKKTIVLSINDAGERYSRLVSDRSGTALQTLDISGKEVNTNGKIYVQSGIGIRTRINFPGLEKFKEKLGNIAINRAELVLEADPATKPDDYIILYKLNSAGNIRQYWNGSSYQKVLIQTDLSDMNGNSSPLIVYHNPATKVYTLNLSSYINAIIQGEEENNGLVITQLQEIYRTTPILITDPSKVKLKIYYTKTIE